MQLSHMKFILFGYLVFATLLQGCANLDAVKTFGKTASEISIYTDAGKALKESASKALPYRSIEPTAADTVVGREEQTKKAAALHASLGSYFAMLAKLSGEDAFSLEKELDAISTGLQSLPKSTADDEIVAAVSLVKTVAKYVLLGVQENAIRQLIDDAGKPAMSTLDNLMRISANWKRMIVGDSRTVDNQLGQLQSPKDAPILAVLLAKDRQQQLAGEYSVTLKRMDAIESALEKIKAAHSTLEANRNQLTSEQLRVNLQGAVADLKALKPILLSIN